MKTTIDEMVEMGLHFGHQTRRWNPKMAPYIYTKRNGIHIIDLIQTYSQLKNVSQNLVEYGSQGKTFLFVGTKKQASGLIAKVALESHSFYVNQRWLGGMLTNWQTIKTSLAKLKEFEIRESNGSLAKLPKKEAAICKKQKERLETYLNGLKEMVTIPDVVVIAGQIEEMNAVLECKKLGIHTITILDTDCDPTLTDLFVVANDDSVKALDFVLNVFGKSIQRGQRLFLEKKSLKSPISQMKV